MVHEEAFIMLMLSLRVQPAVLYISFYRDSEWETVSCYVHISF